MDKRSLNSQGNMLYLLLPQQQTHIQENPDVKHTNTIFAQLLRIISRHKFDSVINRYEGDKRVRHLNCWTQFSIMLYAQLCSRESLRDIVSAWDSHSGTYYHHGVNSVKRSTLAEANAKRSSMYMEVFYWLLNQVKDKTFKSTEAIRLIDSTTIDLCNQKFEWAHFRSGKSGVKLDYP